MDRGHSNVHFRRWVGACVMLAFLAATFVPALSAQTQTTNANALSSKSIEKAVATANVTAEAPKTPKAPKQPANKTGSFFKTRAGIVVLAVMAVGTGYALYSVKEDRIHSAAR